MTTWTHTVDAPCGTILKRVSRSRCYTHMVAAKPSLKQALESPFDSFYTEHFVRTRYHDYVSWIAAAEAAGREHGYYTESLKGATNEDEFLANHIADYFARVEEARLKGYYDSFMALSWHGTEQLAKRRLREAEKWSPPYYETITVLEPKVVVK